MAGEPVYLQIQSKLHSDIIGGIFNPGQMLPSEAELMGRFNASRETIRKSLLELKNKGMLYTRPGKGYFVAQPRHDRYSFSFFDDDKGFESKFLQIRDEVPSEEVRRALALPEKKRVIRVSRLILSHDQPVAFDEKFIPYNKGIPSIEAEIQYTVFPDIVSSKASPFAFYTKMEIGSENADARLRKILDCGAGESLLVLYRYLIGRNGDRLGYGKKHLTARWGKLEAISGYRENSSAP
jgi:GntR family transcriptional regulator